MDTRREAPCEAEAHGEDEALDCLDWETLDNPDEVIPRNDMFPHFFGPLCWCHPEMDDDGMLAHNSFDQRERRELGRKDH